MPNKTAPMMKQCKSASMAEARPRVTIGVTSGLMAALLAAGLLLPAPPAIAQNRAGTFAQATTGESAPRPAVPSPTVPSPATPGPTAPVQLPVAPPAVAAPPSISEAPTLATPPAPGAAGSLSTPPMPGATDAEKRLQLSLSAGLSTSAGKPLANGLIWRIYADMPDPSGEIARPVIETAEAAPKLQLGPGSYLVHVTYGYASAMRKIDLSADTHVNLSINAGGLKVLGSVGDAPIPTAQMRVSVYVPVGQDLEGRKVVEDALPGVVIRLPEGVYHVVSTYGDSNAVMRSDLKVEPGKITEATLHHRAAKMTLKLVQSAGGEAFAGTAFSVLTPGGDVIREEIGAFPTLVLAEGDYVVIARHDGRVHTREFKVEPGENRDVEVLVSQ